MYRVVVVTDGKEYPLLNKALKLEAPVLNEVVGNTPNYLKFSILPDHPHYDRIDTLRSELFVYEDGAELFRGRCVTGREDFNRTHKLSCESDLAYLCDSVMRPFEFKGNIPDFLRMVLDNHNVQVEERKRFRMGNVTVMDSNNYINRSDSHHSHSLDCLRNKLVQTHGGYLRTRLGKDGVRYLDYVTDAGGINSQVIRYGVNLASYEKNRDATSLFTALIPTGAEIEVTGENGSRQTETVNITSVNNGVDYIYDADAVARYGWIFRQAQWEDVTIPENLLSKARAYLEKSIYLSDVLQLTAIDLADMGVDIERLKTGYWTTVKSRPHGVDVTYLLEERIRYLQEPGKGSISLGGRVGTFSRAVSDREKEIRAYVDQVAKSTNTAINRVVDNATKLITGGTGGYVVLDIEDENGERALPWRILIMDSPDKNQAKSVIQFNRNGIGFSTTGIGGPYRNAWTIDGNLVADFITTGTMLADRIRGGTLELGGFANEGGVVIMRDASGKEIGRWDKDGLVATKGSFPAGLITGKITADQIDATNLKVNAANITGMLTANQINAESLTINGKQITAGSIGTERFNSGVSSWVGDIAADKIKTVELSADRIYPNHEGFIWFPRGPVLVTRLQIDRGSSITCVGGMCGTNDYPFAQGWFGSINGSSSRKLKKDIKSYSGGLDVVMKTNVKKYRMRSDETGRIRFGFISEDAPEELATSEREGIDLYNCIGVAFSAIQELQGQINELKGGSVA